MQRMLNLALFCEYLLSLFKKWQFTIYVHFKIGKLPFAYLRTTYIDICIVGILNVFYGQLVADIWNDSNILHI